MAKRISVVRNAFDEPSTKPRLIRAHSQSQAIRHVAKDYTANVASQNDSVEHLPSVRVEDAGADQWRRRRQAGILRRNERLTDQPAATEPGNLVSCLLLTGRPKGLPPIYTNHGKQ